MSEEKNRKILSILERKRLAQDVIGQMLSDIYTDVPSRDHDEYRILNMLAYALSVGLRELYDSLRVVYREVMEGVDALFDRYRAIMLAKTGDPDRGKLITSTMQKMHDIILKSKKKYDLYNFDDRIALLKKVIGQFDCFPKKWEQKPANYYFPSARTLIFVESTKQSAHRTTEKIMALTAPGVKAQYVCRDQYGDVVYDKKGYLQAVESFGKAIIAQKPVAILALTQDEVEHYWSSSARPYRFSDGSQLQVTAKHPILLDDEDSETVVGSRLEFQFTATNGLMSTHAVDFYHINVKDNTSVNLDLIGRQVLLHFFAQCDAEKEQYGLVHCRSSIGRTGQIRWLKALMDAFSNVEKNRRLINQLIEKLLLGEEVFDDERQACSRIFVETLQNVCKQRFAIQGPSQMSETLGQFVLLWAEKHQYSPEDIETLEQYFKIDPYSRTVVNDFAEIVFECEEGSHIIPGQDDDVDGDEYWGVEKELDLFAHESGEPEGEVVPVSHPKQRSCCWPFWRCTAKQKRDPVCSYYVPKPS